MLTFTIRRLVLAVPTLLFISLVIFLLLQLAPGDPMAQVPLTVPPEVKQKMREALGLGQPVHVQYLKWLVQFFWIDHIFGTSFAEGKLRVISWQWRSPVMDVVVQRMPQTLWVVGLSYVVGVLIALPIGIYSAYRQYSIFDQVGTFISMVGFSVPTFFTGVLLIEYIFSLEGLGLLGFEAVINRDYPIVFGTLFIFTLIGLLLKLASDITYVLVDPRIDFSRREV